MSEKLTTGRRVATLGDIKRPGDYCLAEVEENGVTGRCVWFVLPVADPGHVGEHAHESRAAWAGSRRNGLHRVGEPTWTVRECPDGSVEVRPSIACGRADPEGEYWHGYLDEGHIWRQV